MMIRVALGLWLVFAAMGQSPQSLAWMAGTWEGEMWGGHNVESWTAPATDGSMLGSYRFGKGGKPVFYELMAIEGAGDERVMTMRHFGPGLAAREAQDAALRWRVQPTGPQEVVFHQVFPEGTGTRLRYRLAAPGQLVVELIKTKDGKEMVDRFELRRVE
jgi:hypothetical protein